MKLLLLFGACAAVSLGHVVPTVPGDNSHYVEGESRYIWMPNGEGVPVLVDLQEPVDTGMLRDTAWNGEHNEYWLFTRQNDNHDVITFGDVESIWATNFDPSKETRVVVHGWTGNGLNHDTTMIRKALLDEADVNVIVVDWSLVAGTGYLTATLGAPSVGEHLGNFLVWLTQNAGLSLGKVHMLGVSLGGQIVGIAGRTAGGQVRRITGLDPAGPAWGRINSNTIRASDGIYVEIIHTDGRILGLYDRVGDADFYPNGGTTRQPGCALIDACSHRRAVELYSASVYYNHLSGRKCNNMISLTIKRCNGDSLSLGNNDMNKLGSGIFYLTTESSWPY